MTWQILLWLVIAYAAFGTGLLLYMDPKTISSLVLELSIELVILIGAVVFWPIVVIVRRQSGDIKTDPTGKIDPFDNLG